MIRFRDAILAALALLVGATSARADADADRVREKLADYYYAHGQYYRAVGAYEELRLFTTEPRLRLDAGLRIALAYHHGHQIDDAVLAYDDVLRGELDPNTAGRVRILRAVVRADPDAESVPLADVIGELAPLAAGDGTAYQLAATYHLARLQLASANITAARGTYTRAAARCRGASDPACAALPRLDAAFERTPPRTRTPLVGLGLSAVLPGLGSVYNGHPVDGMYYFALTAGSALMALDIYESDRGWRDQRTSFYVLSTLAVTFYGSALVQGWLGTKRFNAVERDAYRRDVLRATAISLDER